MNNIIAKILLAILVLGTAYAVYLIKQNIQLKDKLSDQTINIKSLERGIEEYKAKDGSKWTRVTELRKTNAELKQSKDSTIMSLQNMLIAAGIRLKDVSKVGLVETRLIRDTMFVYGRAEKKDTTINLSRPPHIYQYIAFKGDSISSKLQVNNKQTSITTIKKETVEPRKKFFLWRLFQEKQLVTFTDITNSNPFILTDSNTQINVFNNDLTPKRSK